MIPLVATLLLEASAHGRLKEPRTRSDTNVAIQDRPMKEFACRSAKNPDVEPTEVEAGQTLDLLFDLDAKHPGDVAVYLSYDHDMPYETIDEMKFFKIGNVFDAQQYHMKPVTITLPDWLPGGNAVLRWEWYALHENPNVEFWTQCSDLIVKPTEKELPVEKVPSYRVVINDNARTLPLEGPRRDNNELKKYRKVIYSRTSYKWENPSPSFMTGPECALGFTKNNCPMTGHGTAGHVDVWHEHQEDNPDLQYKRPTLPKISPMVKALSLSAACLLFLVYCTPMCKTKTTEEDRESKSKGSYHELPSLLGDIVSESQRFNLDHETPRNLPRMSFAKSARSSIRRRSSVFSRMSPPLLLEDLPSNRSIASEAA